MNCKNKSFMTKRKAFTLIELLIVIAIIGILFIVLVSKVDFATDKAKATGVQTDFRSFQVAIESVAKEHAGLATFGWDTGDTNGNRIRDSYDKGDANKNGIQDAGEIFVGSKTYGETWNNVYTLTNPADVNDKSAIAALEEAINKNLDPKLHITINDDYTITMANGAQDPWNTEYHGYYITNATVDNKDRGAIVMYSNGANQEWGSEHSIANGVVTINVPGSNKAGKDDYSLAVVYTYVNGYGEVKTTTSGFSNNQGGGQAGTEGTLTGPGSGESEEPIVSPDGLFDESGNLISTWEELVADGIVTVDGSTLTGIDSLIKGYRLVVPGSITTVVNWYNLGDSSKPVGYFGLEGLKVLEFNDGLENFNAGISGIPTSLEKIIFHSSMVKFDNGTYYDDGSMYKGQCFNNPTTIVIEYKGVVYDFRDFNSDAMVAFNSLPECTHWCNEDSSVINCGHENCIWNCGAVSFT